jgi:hypothetical protein
MGCYENGMSTIHFFAEYLRLAMIMDDHDLVLKAMVYHGKSRYAWCHENVFSVDQQWVSIGFWINFSKNQTI